MKNNALLVVVLLAVVAGGLWYKNSMSTKPAGDKMMEESAVPATNSAGTSDTMSADGVREIRLEGSEFKFSLASLTLKKGEKVRLILGNTGKMKHDFVVDELNVRTKIINNGETDTVEFTPETAGTFEFYCSVGQHRANGMKGMLTVE